jgi:hypothetical protein
VKAMKGVNLFPFHSEEHIHVLRRLGLKNRPYRSKEVARLKKYENNDNNISAVHSRFYVNKKATRKKILRVLAR